jgi:hypothetical protein
MHAAYQNRHQAGGVAGDAFGGRVVVTKRSFKSRPAFHACALTRADVCATYRPTAAVSNEQNMHQEAQRASRSNSSGTAFISADKALNKELAQECVPCKRCVGAGDARDKRQKGSLYLCLL